MMVAQGPVVNFADRSARSALLVEHAAVLGLCLEWEQLADALPRRPGRLRWLNLARGLAALCDVHLPRIDSAMADIMRAEGVPGHLINHAARLMEFSLADADHARDVEAAMGFGRASAAPRQAEALGYMLRCLFDGCRRAILAREILLSAIVTPR